MEGSRKCWIPWIWSHSGCELLDMGIQLGSLKRTASDFNYHPSVQPPRSSYDFGKTFKMFLNIYEHARDLY